MESRHNFLINLCVALLLPCLAGCGEKLAKVAGTVRLDGKPVAAAGVALHPRGRRTDRRRINRCRGPFPT